MTVLLLVPGRAPFLLLRKPVAAVLVLVTGLFAGSAVLAQPASLPDAADIDWVSWDKLTDAQKAQIPNGCCGLYVEPAVPALAGDPEQLHVNADKSSSNDDITEVSGNLYIQQGKARLTADRGVNDENKQLLSLYNNIRLRQPGLLMTGKTATFQRALSISELTSASYLLHATGVRGTAGTLTYQADQELIIIHDGEFTRCEPGDNAWMIKGSTIELDRQSGLGTAHDVTLNIKDVPILYLPWVRFPIDDRRASGFLAPIIGSTRNGGFDLSTPYYFNLAPNYDLTLTPRLQANRGLMLGADARYLGVASKQEFSFDYLPDDQLYDAATATIPGTTTPPVPNRWSTDYSLAASLGSGWSAGINYRGVSDQNFFRDFGLQGLNSTLQSYLYRNAALYYQDQHWAFSASTENIQIIDPTVTAIHAPYSTLPRLKLDGKYWLPFGLQYGVSAEYTNFQRDLNTSSFSQTDIANGVLVTGSRLAVTPEISLPLSTTYFFFTPTLKYKYAAWSLNDQASGLDSSPSRGIVSANIDSGLIFERDTNIFGSDYRQTLEPRLYYLYNQYKNQNDIPLFDTSELTFSFNQLFRDDRFSGKDRVGDARQLTLAVTSRLYDAAGIEKADFSLGQIHYFADRRVTLAGVPGPAQLTAQSALTGEFNYLLADHWRTSSYLEWNTHTNRADVGSVQLQYQRGTDHIVNIAWRYRDIQTPVFVNGYDPRIKQSDVSAVWPLGGNWNMVGRWDYDYSNQRTLEGIAGIEYGNCCWRIRVVGRSWVDNLALYFGRSDNNSGVFVQFELNGLGSILGGNVTNILNNGISGFQDRNNGIN